MKVIEARSHAHGVMPSDRKRPPDQSAQNALADRQRKNAALARKQPGHCNAANPGKRNEHRIRPMQRGKNRACNQRGARRTICCAHKAISCVGIQTYLLKQAKCHVAEKMFRRQQAIEGAVQTTESQTHKAKPEDEGHEHWRRAFWKCPCAAQSWLPAKRETQSTMTKWKPEAAKCTTQRRHRTQKPPAYSANGRKPWSSVC